MTKRSYAGGATPGTLSTSMSTSTFTFTPTGILNWPNGSAGPFQVLLGRGLSNEEKILCSSLSSGVITINQRGWDGTTAQNHSPGESVELISSATDAAEANDHVNRGDSVHGLAGGDYVVGRTTPATLTGKTMDGGSNTFNNIPRGASPQLQADIAAANALIAAINASLAGFASTTALTTAISAEQTARANADATLLPISVAAATYLPLAGGTATGPISDASAPTLPAHLTNKTYTDAQDAAMVAGIYATGKTVFTSQVLTVNASGQVDLDMTALGFTTIIGIVICNGDGTLAAQADQIYSKISGAAAKKQRLQCRTGGANVGNGTNVRVDALVLGTV